MEVFEIYATTRCTFPEDFDKLEAELRELNAEMLNIPDELTIVVTGEYEPTKAGLILNLFEGRDHETRIKRRIKTDKADQKAP